MVVEMDKQDNQKIPESLGTLSEDNVRLVQQFGAKKVEGLKGLPDFYTFRNKLIHSHRDFDVFLSRITKGERSAIVSGFNASGTPHVGHLPVFDTNLFFQKHYGAQVFIPISDDESYVSLKVKTQEEALRNSLFLARSIVAFGFDLAKTKIIIDQLYTNIYNFAIKLSRGVTLSEIRAVYGYTPDNNIGLQFYPMIQAAHVLLPQTFGIKNVLVPIGPDEDAHLRVCRDLAGKFGFEKPAVLHSVFMPGLDGSKMSKSKGNAIFFSDTEKTIKKAVMSAFSGGQTSVEEHRKLGGNPEVDVAYFYLKSYFLEELESQKLAKEYRAGKVLSGEMKSMLFEKVMKRVDDFKSRYNKVTLKDIEKVLLKNDDIDLALIAEKAGLFQD